MSQLSNLSTFLLVNLEQSGAQTGYDLTTNSKDSSVWSSSHQQVYRELKRLLADGFVSAEHVAQEGRPDKKLYKITPRGKVALEDSLASFSCQTEKLQSIFISGIPQ